MPRHGFSDDEAAIATQSADPDFLHPLINSNREVPNGHYVVARHYEKSDHVEICGIKLLSRENLRRGGGATRRNAQKTEMDALTLAKSQCRARTAVRRKCLALSTDRILTLTFRENVQELPIAWACFKRFTKNMRQHYGEAFKYVAVPEYQARGAVHFHLAISGHYPVKKVRECWRKAVGAYGGNIDITSPKKYGYSSWNPRNVARYISKYISKADITDFNKKRYSSGGRIQVPEPKKGWIALGAYLPQIFSQVIKRFTQNEIACYWESGDRLGIVYCST